MISSSVSSSIPSAAAISTALLSGRCSLRALRASPSKQRLLRPAGLSAEQS